VNTEQKIIGVDLDEVLVEFLPSFLEFFERKNGTRIPINTVRSYNFWESGLGKTREEAIALALVEEFYQSRDFDNLPTTNGAEAAMTELSKSGLIYVVTSRPSHFKSKTTAQLRKHFPAISSHVIYTGDFNRVGKTKAEVCQELALTEFYEDNLSYARACAPHVRRVYLFDKPWNQGEVNGNITRVISWQEAMQRRVT
jgi:uncharacterized HAD superfamily protein